MFKFMLLMGLIFVLSGCNSSKKNSVVNQGGQTTGISCPDEFVVVKGNSTFNTSDFCIMKYEAKCQETNTSNFCSPTGGAYDVTKVAVSDPDGAPWTDINPIEAKSACQALGAKYDLISNDEWMTLARDAEAQSANWFSGVVGSGCIYQGNVTRNGDCTYNSGIGVDFGLTRNSKAKLVLQNNSEIYDFVGNVNEWVDWVSGGSFDHAPSSCPLMGNVNIYVWTCADVSLNSYMPGNPANISDYGSIHGNGLGKEFGSSTTLQGAAYRGGSYYSATGYGFAGLFALGLNYDDSTAMFQTGFRCVYRP
jgi:formylglycine-generating enzyme required for sulfatase activity